MMYKKEKLRGLLFGMAIGDAMGVPFEFLEAEDLGGETFKEMKGFGTYNQPPGTFSDDTSLTLCTIEALINNLSQEETAKLFIKWKNEGYWAVDNEVFDIGNTTRDALEAIEKGIPIYEAAPSNERSCGNGALMRILPLALYCDNKSFDEIYEMVVKFASITHGHIRSHMACFMMVVYVHELFQVDIPNKIHSEYHRVVWAHKSKEIKEYFESHDKFKDEIINFEPVLNLWKGVNTTEIENSGYVLHSLNLVMNFFFVYKRYEMNVIGTLRCGGDTDTNACIIGGLSGILYGMRSIPEKWLEALRYREQIEALCARWEESLADKLI